MLSGLPRLFGCLNVFWKMSQVLLLGDAGSWVQSYRCFLYLEVSAYFGTC